MICVWYCHLLRIDRVLFHPTNNQNRLARYTFSYSGEINMKNQKVSFSNCAPPPCAHTHTHTNGMSRGKKRMKEKSGKKRSVEQSVIDWPCSLTHWHRMNETWIPNWRWKLEEARMPIIYFDSFYWNGELSPFVFRHSQRKRPIFNGDTNRIQAYAWYS